MPGTMDQLVADLLRKPADGCRNELLERARAGEYHDFKSPHVAPKVRLISDLERYGYRDLARRARRGDYDDPPDAEDNREQVQFLAKNPDGLALLEALSRTSEDPAAQLAAIEAALRAKAAAEGSPPEELEEALAEVRLMVGKGDA